MTLPLRLIYASRFAPGFPVDAEAQRDAIGKIIRASIRNNRDVAITGLLLAHQGWFVQALEGPVRAVADTYARILRDDRHVGPIVLAEGSAMRAFADWNMCARRVSRADDAIVESLGGAGFDPPAWSAENALSVLLEVRDLQSATMTALV